MPNNETRPEMFFTRLKHGITAAASLTGIVGLELASQGVEILYETLKRYGVFYNEMKESQQKQAKALVIEAIELTKSRISPSQRDLLTAVNLDIADAILSSQGNFEELISISLTRYSQQNANWNTNKDINIIADIFLQCLYEKLLQYPDAKDLVILDKLSFLQEHINNLEMRIEAVEKYSSQLKSGNLTDLPPKVKFSRFSCSNQYCLSDQNIGVNTSKSYYVSRKKTIEALRSRLSENHIVFLWGMSGIGKSEAAREYAEAFRSEYRTIQMVTYDISLKNTVANLQYKHNQELKHKNGHEEYNNKWLDLMGYDEKTLLIIDNFNEDLVQNLQGDSDETLAHKRENADTLMKLAKNLKLHILITSKICPERGIVSDHGYLEISELSEDELKRMFFAVNPYGKNEPERIHQVDELIKITYRHTMTVDLVAHLSRDAEEYNKAGLTEICEILKNVGIGQLNDNVVHEKDSVLKSDTIYAHIKALFDFSKMDEAERYVLSNLCLVPVSGMNKGEFCSWISVFGKKDRYIAVIKKLIRVGWVKEQNGQQGRIYLHPLVNDMTRTELQPHMDSIGVFCFALENKIREYSRNDNFEEWFIAVVISVGDFLCTASEIQAAGTLMTISIYLATIQQHFILKGWAEKAFAEHKAFKYGEKAFKIRRLFNPKFYHEILHQLETGEINIKKANEYQKKSIYYHNMIKTIIKRSDPSNKVNI